jgi:outer membrane protein OmpA-like peptidoglycan-associated protein
MFANVIPSQCALRVIVTAFATAAIMLAVAAPRAAAAPRPAQQCMAPPATPDPSSPVIAVLAGITKSDNASGSGSVRRAAISKVVDAGFSMKARLLVDTVGSGAKDADLAVNTQLVAAGPNDLFRHTNQTCKQNGVTAATNELLNQRISGPTDVLAALQVLQSHLTGLTKQPIQVVLLSSMLNGAEPLLLGPRTLRSDPQQLIAAVRRAGLMPSCHNWRAYVIGGGQTASGGLSDALNARLKAFWNAFFEACGGQLIVYDSALTQFPVQPATAVTQTHRRNVLVITLPASVLFDSGRSDLRSSSQAALSQLLNIVKHHRHGAITVSGYTDSIAFDGSGGNVGLSKRRADAVVSWLTRHGIRNGRIRGVGLGAADPVASDDTAAGRQANRRVEVTIVSSR